MQSCAELVDLPGVMRSYWSCAELADLPGVMRSYWSCAELADLGGVVRSYAKLCGVSGFRPSCPELCEVTGDVRSCAKLLEMCGVVRRSAELEGLRRICWELFGVRWNKMVTAEFAELWELAEVHCVMGPCLSVVFRGRPVDFHGTT